MPFFTEQACCRVWDACASVTAVEMSIVLGSSLGQI